MTKVAIVPNIIPFDDGYQIFLAGAIDMGKAVDWQSEVIERLQGHDKLSIYSPRRSNDEYTVDTRDEQIRWELQRLDASDLIFMWFPREALAPISFLESGLFWRSGKIIVGAEQGFYRRRNLEITAEHYALPNGIYDNLDDMIRETKWKYHLYW